MANPSDQCVVRNAADPRQVKAARKRESRLRREVLDDFRAVMAIPAGRRVVWKLLELANLYGSSFSSDAVLMAFNEGKRSMGTTLLRYVVEAVPDALPALMKEMNPEPAVEPEGEEPDKEEPENG